MDHVSLNAARRKSARQPETIAAGFGVYPNEMRLRQPAPFSLIG